MQKLNSEKALQAKQKIIEIMNEDDEIWAYAPNICAQALNEISCLRGSGMLYCVQSGYQYEFLGLNKRK